MRAYEDSPGEEAHEIARGIAFGVLLGASFVAGVVLTAWLVAGWMT